MATSGRRSHSLSLASAFVLLGALQLSFWSSTFVSPLLRGGRPDAWRPTGRAFEASRVARAARGGADVTYEVGDKVKAMSPDDEQWYPGKVDADNGDGTFSVRWDDPDGGPETNNLAPASMKKIIIFRDYAVGDDVRAVSPDDDRWYPGVVSKVLGEGTFQVKWDDPDGGDETADVDPEQMKKVIVFKDYKADDEVEALYPEDGGRYAAVVVSKNSDGTFKVKWDDPDGGPEESDVSPKDMKYPPIPFDSLEVGQKYKGTVRNIMDFGAFVDIGSESEGLLHISCISNDRVESVYDYVEEGQEVDVWISGLRDDGKFGLTMVEGKTDGGGGGRRGPQDLGPFVGTNPNDWFDGVVVNTPGFGAFVEVTLPDGASAQGLVHISQIRDGFVESVEDEVQVGQEVKVRVESVDEEAGRLSLSMKEPWGGGGGGGGSREPADLSAFENIAPDQWLEGKVARTASFGAFVTVTAPESDSSADGLVHITQIRDGFVESVEDEIQPGQEVKVRVISVDVGAGKMSLSMKEEEVY